jgi:hypothetical protein
VNAGGSKHAKNLTDNVKNISRSVMQRKILFPNNFFKDNLNHKTIACLVISLQTLTFAQNSLPMFWTLELASYLEEAPWPATKDELIDYAIRSGAPIEVVENLQELEDEGEVYESIEDIWPDYPSQEDFMFNEDEY